MDPKEAIVLANQYGIATVVCFVVIAILVWVLRTNFLNNDKRESRAAEREEAMAKIINGGLGTLAAGMNELAKSISANTIAIGILQTEFKEAAKFVRSEHAEMLVNQESLKGELNHGLGTIRAVIAASKGD